MAAIALEHVDKIYPNGFAAARDLSLRVEDGELLVLVGPSGSGKSTVLRMIAGLEQVSAGRIAIGERDVTDLPPQERDLAMVFQSYALYPHMTVRENMAFGLRMRHVPARESEERVRRVAASLQIDSLLDRKPAQLSGGQRQRVALARAIVREPAAFLFDEPLSNLDARLRLETRTELARLHRRLGATMVYVTHDQVEAMTLGQRVAVLRAGVLQQLGPPLTLHDDPSNRFVAGFIGSPPMEFIEGRLEHGESGVALRAGARAIPVPTPRAVSLPMAAAAGIRPSQVELTSPDASDASVLPGVVSVVEQLGREQVVHIELDLGESHPTQRITSVVPAGTVVQVDQVVGARLPAAGMLLFGEDGERMRTAGESNYS